MKVDDARFFEIGITCKKHQDVVIEMLDLNFIFVHRTL
jgi:hypothetical protein